MELDDPQEIVEFALDEHLKGKEFIKEEENETIFLLDAQQHFNSIERFNRKLLLLPINFQHNFAII